MNTKTKSGMYVYLLKSIPYPNQTYIGITANLKQRIKNHNCGQSKHSSKFKPWKVITVIWFDNPQKAIKFERYLKIGSGHAFAKRHFW